MTGSIQEKNGVLYTVIYVGGKHKWQTTGLSKRGSMKRAKEILEERMSLLERECMVITKNISFADFMLEWLEIIEIQVRPTTFHQYALLVKNSIVPYFKKQKIMLHELQPIHIQRYYSMKMKSGAGANTVKHHHANIRKALNYALKNDWIPYNPADRVELPKVNEFIGNFYTPEQIRMIF